MNNKTSKSKKRFWTQIAEDVGFVLRKNIVEERRLKTLSQQRKHMASQLIDSLLKNSKLHENPEKSAKKVFLISTLPKKHRQQIKSSASSHINRLKSLKQMYESDQSTTFYCGSPDKPKQLEEQKRRDAELMRSYLHKLKVQSNVQNFYHHRQKCYKVWKNRVTSKVSKNIQKMNQV